MRPEGDRGRLAEFALVLVRIAYRDGKILGTEVRDFESIVRTWLPFTSTATRQPLLETA